MADELKPCPSCHQAQKQQYDLNGIPLPMWKWDYSIMDFIHECLCGYIITEKALLKGE